jgi:hypothetical protein
MCEDHRENLNRGSRKDMRNEPRWRQAENRYRNEAESNRPDDRRNGANGNREAKRRAE